MPDIVRYPLDLTGTSPDNYVQGELHTPVKRNVRAIAPTYGAFFTESLAVVDVAANRTLDKGIDFDTAELFEIPTQQTGKEVCSIILITNTAVGDNISISYQCVGGVYSVSANAILQLIEALQIDNRPVTFDNITQKPATGYPAAPHLHDAGDLYGFEYLVTALERLRTAVLVGDESSHKQVYQYVDDKYNALTEIVNKDAIIAIINSILTDYNAVLARMASMLVQYMGTMTDLKAQVFDYDTQLNDMSGELTNTDLVFDALRETLVLAASDLNDI